MGLDMYLHRKYYVKNWEHNPIEERFQVSVKQNGLKYAGVDPKKVCEVVEEIGYWRKANAVHQWFVDNTQGGDDNNGEESYVSREKLAKLLEIAQEILKDHSRAPELLPTQEGFFFGSTDYDEWYFVDLESTVKIITEALKNPYGDIYYRSSW